MTRKSSPAGSPARRAPRPGSATDPQTRQQPVELLVGQALEQAVLDRPRCSTGRSSSRPSRASSSSSHHSSAWSSVVERERSSAATPARAPLPETASLPPSAARDAASAARKSRRRRGRRGSPGAGRSRPARPSPAVSARLRETASAATNPSSPWSSKIAVRREPRGSRRARPRSAAASSARSPSTYEARTGAARLLTGAHEVEREVVREVAADADAAHAVAALVEPRREDGDAEPAGQHAEHAAGDAALRRHADRDEPLAGRRRTCRRSSSR